MRWYVIDDHEAFRSAAQRLLESADHMVVGSSDGADGTDAAVAAIIDSRADAALLDVNLPSTDGFVIARGVAAKAPEVRCVLISSRPRATYERRLDASPALGFVSKSDLSPEALAVLLG